MSAPADGSRAIVVVASSGAAAADAARGRLAGDGAAIVEDPAKAADAREAKRIAVFAAPDGEGVVPSAMLEIGAQAGMDSYLPCFASDEGMRYGEIIERPAPEGLGGEELAAWRRSAARQLWEEAMILGEDLDRNLSQMLVASARRYGMDLPVFHQEMPTELTLSFKLLLRAAFALGGELSARHKPGERVGLMLPTSAGTAAAFYGSLMAGLVPVMLNFSAGRANLQSACHTAEVKTVYTAKGLLDRLEVAAEGAKALEEDGVKVVALEDLRAQLSLKAKLGAVLGMLFPNLRLSQLPGGSRRPEDPALILFTSGSEGHPKGVVLTHRNIVTNAAQVLTRLQLGRDEKLVNSLPVFHSFGMLGGMVLPVAGGVRSIQVPSPLLFNEIPALIAKQKATILFSTSTFFAQYAKHAKEGALDSLTLMVAGGERLQPQVRELWLDKLGKEIMEGYGVTETSPAASICIPGYVRPGSIGLLLPLMRMRIDKREGIEVGGGLMLGGPNIMSGYMFAEEPGKIVPPEGGWHDTGDIASADSDGYLRIVGRLKRFAKIAGEMVSLTQLEGVLVPALGEGELGAVVSIADADRGERLVYATNSKDLTRERLQELIKEAGLPELYAPRAIQVLEDFPLMPTGKTDYPGLERLLNANRD